MEDQPGKTLLEVFGGKPLEIRHIYDVIHEVKPETKERALIVFGDVARFRQHMEKFWATPTFVDSMRYAFTEMGEVYDAALRLSRPHDARNNMQECDPFDPWRELADVAIMVASALIVADAAVKIADVPEFNHTSGLGRIAGDLTGALFFAELTAKEDSGGKEWARPAATALCAIVSAFDLGFFPGYSIVAVRERLARVWRKRRFEDREKSHEERTELDLVQHEAMPWSEWPGMGL